MRISTQGRYALRAMVDLAMHVAQGPVTRMQIAERQEISASYLAHLFTSLRQAGLVESVKGPGGGYTLIRKAEEITAGDVLRAVEEQLDPVYCLKPTPDKNCPMSDVCRTQNLWRRLGDHMIALLDSVTLADLCTEDNQQINQI